MDEQQKKKNLLLSLYVDGHNVISSWDNNERAVAQKNRVVNFFIPYYNNGGEQADNVGSMVVGTYCRKILWHQGYYYNR